MNDRERVVTLLRNITALPTLPDVAVRLLDMGEDRDASMQDMARLVERDVALATRMLRMVNSSYFGMRREVTSIQHAVMVLGTAQLRGLVLSGAVSEMFDRQGGVGSFSRAEFWRHSIGVAAAAKAVATESRRADPEIAFTGGLIHDMGKVVVDRYLHADFIMLVTLFDREHLTMSDAETQILGVSHAEIGNHLALHWNLPQVLRDAVGYHHNPADAPIDPAMAATIAVADNLVRTLQIGDGGGADPILAESELSLAGLDESRYARLLERLADVLPEQVDQLASAA